MNRHIFMQEGIKVRVILIALLLFIVSNGFCALESTDSTKVYFEQSFCELKNMLEGKQPCDFERAVFVSENAYHNNQYNYNDFKAIIDEHQQFIEMLASANDKSDSIDFSVKVNANGRFNVAEIRYTEKEKKELYQKTLKNWAIFTYITDTTAIFPFYHLPFSYSTNDPFGMKDWSNSQMMNLLFSDEQQGNCFALTGFYKIIANRLQTGARICTAPQHIYIQHQDHKGDYYNVELATAGHPGDGKIQTLTYTTNEAIMNGIALRSYTDNESIGLCLVNLAKSYEHKFNTKDDAFILKCAELVLQHDSLNLSALLLKQQVLDARVTTYALQNKVNDLNRIKADKDISGTLSQLQKHLAKLYELGYKQMPLDMQQMVLNGFREENTATLLMNKNPKPFTSIKPNDPNDERYWTVSRGAFQEVFESKKTETYGHFVFDTETKTITVIDTTTQNNFLIDPVAFAYDFGARGYDSRLGIFTSVDPLAKKYPGSSPYLAFNGCPILFVDKDGREGTIYISVLKNKEGKPVLDKVDLKVVREKLIKTYKDMYNVDVDVKFDLSGKVFTKKEFENRAEYKKPDHYLIVGKPEQLMAIDDDKATGWERLGMSVEVEREIAYVKSKTEYVNTLNGYSADKVNFGMINSDNVQSDKNKEFESIEDKLANTIIHEKGHRDFQNIGDKGVDKDGHTNNQGIMDGKPINRIFSEKQRAALIGKHGSKDSRRERIRNYNTPR